MNVDSVTKSSELGKTPMARVGLAAGSRRYVVFVLVALFFAFAVSWRYNGIFACPGDGYGSGGYLAYCQATGYGDYDHGAMWFGLEPETLKRVAKAKVLFLGSSRLQFALSTAATSEWFASRTNDYYLLGFSHSENVGFIEPLLKKIEPRAAVYVLNVDQLFDSRETDPASVIFRNSDALERYRTKRRWQPLHRALCGGLPLLCGHHIAFYRDRDKGFWIWRGAEAEFQPSMVEDAPSEDTSRWSTYVDRAREFVDRLPVSRSCVVLTLVPTHGTRIREATAIADSLGIKLVSPQVEGLKTFDGSHLDQRSAELWSSAFLAAGGADIDRCLGDGRGS